MSFFERQNITGCCKQTFCVQSRSKAKHLLSGLLNGLKNSNFFKIGVEWSDSMKQNYGGFTFIISREIVYFFILSKTEILKDN